MSLSHADYLNIMKFYKIDVSNISKKKIKIMAEDILANKLCKCIKKVTPLMKNEENAIAVCRKSVLREKKITNFGFRCKKGARFIPKKGTNKNLAKIKRKTNVTRKRRKKNKSRRI